MSITNVTRFVFAFLLFMICTLPYGNFNMAYGKVTHGSVALPNAITTNIEKTDVQQIYGNWKIVKYTPGKVVGLTDEQAKLYIHKTVLFKSNLAVIAGDTCKAPRYAVKQLNAANYFDKNYRIDKKLLNIEATDIEVVSLTCKANPVYASAGSPAFDNDVIIYDRKTLIIHINGMFFYLKKG